MQYTELWIPILTAITLILSGTIAGYITNKYAVRWLFKPVKLFGRRIFDVSILGTEEKQTAFIESLSSCVEEKILTGEILKKEIINETMKAHLDEIVDQFITEALPDQFKNQDTGSLKGFAETEQGIRELLSEILDENGDDLLRYLLKEVKLSDYITETQIQSGTDSLYACIQHAFKNNGELREALTKILTELFFSAMFHPEGRSALAKLTGKLFGGGNSFGNLSSLRFPEKINASIKKIITSAVSGRIHEKTADSFLKENSRKSLFRLLQKEILKKYDALLENAARDPLPDLISELSGSEKIKQVLSDLIYDFLNQNIAQLFGGRVKDTIKIALGRLDPDQLCEIAERLMKGELKYLSYFGGILGFLLSIPALGFTLGQFSPAGFPQSPGVFLLLTALMGFIGVITNVIAIAMFFHPYKKNPFLAKYRHTRVFSQGVILQNQKVFAHTLGEYIGAELLTPENIIKMLDSHKTTFLKTLSDGIQPYLTAYFQKENNRKKASAKLSALLFNKTMENRDTLAALFTGEAGGRTFGSLIDLNCPETREKASRLYMSFLDRTSVPPVSEDSEARDFQFIVYALCSLIKSNSSLTEKVWRLLETFYTAEIAPKRLEEFFSLPELTGAAKETLSRICQNDAAFDTFRNAVQNCISALVENSEKYISSDFIQAAAEKAAEAAHDALRNGIPSLMADVRIAEITEERVASLKPDEIQEVILSFAQPAFRKLYGLGLIGCIFGLNTYLAFLLYLIDKAADRK